MPIRMTTSSYVVLSLVEQLQPATAYDLKRLAHSTVFNFWAMPHTVLYSETKRLHDADLLSAEQEDGGRRRRRFSLTSSGLAALDQWRAEPTDEFLELRDPGLLRLFVGTEPRALAAKQLARHQSQLDEYEQLDHALRAGQDPQIQEIPANGDSRSDALRSTVAAGIAIEREYVRFWSTVARHGSATSFDAGDPAHTRPDG